MASWDKLCDTNAFAPPKTMAHNYPGAEQAAPVAPVSQAAPLAAQSGERSAAQSGGPSAAGSFPFANYADNQRTMDQQMQLTDMRQAESTQRQTQIELRKAEENDRANVARLRASINDITLGVQTDRLRSEQAKAKSIRGLL